MAMVLISSSGFSQGLTFKNIATNPVSLIFILHNANTGVSQIYGDLTGYEGAPYLEENGISIGSTNSFTASVGQTIPLSTNQATYLYLLGRDTVTGLTWDSDYVAPDGQFLGDLQLNWQGAENGQGFTAEASKLVEGLNFQDGQWTPQ